LAARARPCAVRTYVFELIATPNEALRAPPPPIAASVIIMRPPQKLKMRSLAPAPPHHSFADPFGNILGWKCTSATIRPNFFRFFLFCIASRSFLFVVLLLFLLSFLISSYSSLLILLFLPLLILLVGTMLRLLILVFLYIKLFFVLQTWYIRHSEGFFEGAKPFFYPFGVKIYVYGATMRPNFFVLSFFIVFLYLFFLFLSSYSSLLIYIFILFGRGNESKRLVGAWHGRARTAKTH
jgi:hypothetical protein